MGVEIHPSAIVETGAELDDGVKIGAFCYIGPEVKLGANTEVMHHASVEGNTVMGSDCQVFPYAYIGGKTQDLKFKGGDLGLTIGDRNVFREYVTVHMSTIPGIRTTLGDDNNLLAHSHVAHDCTVGSHLIMSSNAALGGHCVVDDHVYIAFAVGVLPFVRVGRYAIAGAMAKVTKDLPPYMMVEGAPAKVRTINKVRLEREGYSTEDIDIARNVHRILYRGGNNRSQAIEALKAHPNQESWFVKGMIDFIDVESKMGCM
ncbi:MAG: acyl-ACP--UDP-N-acetylglucosamine O-acyltransferase [Opitutales bacterium]